MGFFGSFSAEKYDRQYSDRQLFRRAIQYFKPHWKALVLLLVTVLLISAISSIQPIIISSGVDQLSEGALTRVYWIIGGLLGLGLLNYGVNYVNRFTLVKLLADIIVTLSETAFSASMYHDLSFYDETNTGKIISRITSDTQEFGNLVSILSDVFTQLIQALVLLVVLFTIEWRLTLLSLLIVPLTMTATYMYRKLARKATRQGMRAMANVNSTIKETISGISVAKNFRQEHSIYGEFDEANRESYKVNVRRGIILHLMFPSLRTIGGAATALMVYFGGLTAVEGAITVGAWYLFLQSLDRFLWPILNLSTFWTNIQNGLAAAERVFALIDAKSTVNQTDNKPVSTIKGEIKFINIGFAYNEKECVLRDFNLHICPGETLAIVGHTGSGKTSIARLIERFYEYQSGTILIDGQDIRTFDLAQYRSQLGIVSQVPFLFSGTVLDNIRYGNPQTTVADILKVANQIGDGDWLDTLPNGLETPVGERGGQLSMGQRQLISLMRVLVSEPSIFILDEATASIDPFTEWQIQQALDLIMKKTTSILIAHRLSTVKAADRIITIENGKIIEEGNHQQLLEKGGHYANLYDTYFRHQSLSYVENAMSLKQSAS
jgi:ATP-binding cassette, subfamily B, bacterial